MSIDCPNCNEQISSVDVFDDPNTGVAHNLKLCDYCGTVVVQRVWANKGLVVVPPKDDPYILTEAQIILQRTLNTNLETNMPNKVTNEDINMICYFIEDKGDITAWSQWEDKKPLVEEEYPELIKAIKEVDVAKVTLQRILNSIYYDKR